jgi:hypothetical protein
MPIVPDTQADMFGNHLQQENDRACHIQTDKERSVHPRLNQKDNDGIEEDDRQDDMVIEQSLV